MAVELSDLKEQIEKAKESLKSVDQNIKKITGRDPNEPRPGAEGRRLSAGGPRGRDFGTVLGRRNRDVQERTKDSEPPRKRVAVFSRLGPAAGGRRVVLTGRRTSKHEEINDDEDEEEQAMKPAIQSSVVSTAKQITKNELISAQNVGERGKARNRRMFGMLLGTLARFDKDSRGRQSKQVQKQKEVETRLEEETAEERRSLASQRRTLFNERRSQQRRIQLLEQKIALADELTEWEKEWNKKSNFIMTKASPSIFFMPNDFTPRTQRALQDSKGRIKEIIEKHKKSLEETMNAYDDEINILEGKQENEDGKGDKNLGNNLGSRVINSRKRGVNEEEPEEERDLDSMEPQVDIKVEMDENEAEEGDNGRVSNGVQYTEINDALHPDNQNRDIAMGEEEEGEAERTQESKDHQQIIMKQEAPNTIDEDTAWKETDDKPNDEPVEKPEVMQVDIELNVVTGRSGEEQQEKPVQNEQEEDSEALPPDVVGDQKQESSSETENATESVKPGEEQWDNHRQDSLREKGVNEEKMAETTELVISEESDCGRSVEKQTDKSKTTIAETLPMAEREKDSSGNTVSTQAHSSSSSDSENDVTLKSLKEATVKKKSSDGETGEFGRTAHGKQNLKQRSREKSLSGDSRKESKDEKKDSRRKRTKAKKSTSEQSSYEKEQIKRKEKEPVRRKGSTSERVGERRKSETSSGSESSSKSSENDRRNKRSSASRGYGKRRSRERRVSIRSSGGSRRRSRSKSRERQTNRRDRRRR